MSKSASLSTSDRALRSVPEQSSHEEKDTAQHRSSTLQNWLLLGQLRSEKCELAEAKIAFAMALKLAKRSEDVRSMMEALAGLLRLAGEALNETEVSQWEAELDELMTEYSRQIPPMAWYCKGYTAHSRRNFLLAQRHFHRYLKTLKKEKNSYEEKEFLTALLKGYIAFLNGWNSSGALRW